MAEPDDEHPVQLRRTNSGNKREITVAAVVSAAALAWTITAAWVSFRDSVYRSIYDINVRVETIATGVEGGRQLNDERLVRIVRIEEQLNRIVESVGSLRDGLERRFDAIQKHESIEK
jgi:Mg2+ and Co2+ transporter CorA